ncbi:MAG: serine kinase [Syntrophales bacterium]|nr:serine kinase [Syntrophales bacterium]
MLTLADIVNNLGLQIRSGSDKLPIIEVKGGYVGDLLSDVMAGSKEGDLWITRKIHQNIVAVASLKDHAGIVLVAASEPAPDTLEKARREGIPLLVSELPAFELCGRIYNMLVTAENPQDS